MEISLAPVFTYYRSQYKDSYDLIETFIKDYKGDFPIDSVLKIMNAAKLFRERTDTVGEEGIIKITDTTIDISGINTLIQEYGNVTRTEINAFESTNSDKSDPTYSPTALSSGVRVGDTYIVQFAIDANIDQDALGIKLGDLIKTIQPVPNKSPQEDAIKNLTSFCTKDAVYMVYQKIPDGTVQTKLKDTTALSANLHFVNKKDEDKQLESYMTKVYGSLTAANKPTLATLGIAVGTNLEVLVRSLTDRVLPLMAALYFKKKLNEAVKKAE